MPFISCKNAVFRNKLYPQCSGIEEQARQMVVANSVVLLRQVSKTCHDPVRLNFSLWASSVLVGIVCVSFRHRMKSWRWNCLECSVLFLWLFQVIVSHSGLYVGCSAVWFSSLYCFHAYHIHYEVEFVHFFTIYRALSLAVGGMSSFLSRLFQKFVCVCVSEWVNCC
jgi:hypothetical protein